MTCMLCLYPVLLYTAGVLYKFYMVFFNSAVSVSPELNGFYCVFTITFTCCCFFFTFFLGLFLRRGYVLHVQDVLVVMLSLSSCL